MNEVTQILQQIESGDPSAAELLLPLVYEELRKLAAVKLANEKSGNSIEATGLVHEAYLRLVDVDQSQHWNSRGHFFSAAAEAMRRLLVERARQRRTLKRGNQLRRIPFQEEMVVLDHRQFDLLEIDDAITQLGQHDPQTAKLVKLRFFAGLSHQEAAEAMGISRRVADRHWLLAKAWLTRALQESHGDNS